jgi:hypothetical protein
MSEARASPLVVLAENLPSLMWLFVLCLDDVCLWSHTDCNWCQVLRVGDRRKRTDFCDLLLEDMKDDTFFPRLILSDEAMFHLSGIKFRATMFACGDLRIHKNLFSMSAIHRKLTFLGRFLLNRFMALSFDVLTSYISCRWGLNTEKCDVMRNVTIH